MTSFKGLIIFAMMIILLGYTSAFEFDNIGEYTEQDSIVEISNTFLWLYKTDKIMEIEILPCNRYSTIEKCLAPRGNDIMVGKFNIYSLKDYEDFLNYIDIYDLKRSNQKVFKNIVLKKQVNKTINVNRYSTKCSDENKDSLNCNKVVNGKYQEIVSTWEEVNDFDLKAGENYTFGIFTDVSNGEHKDWVPSVAGFEIDKWAEWQESYEVGLVSWFKLDNPSGAVIDWTEYHDGTNGNSTTRGVDGYINKSFDFERDNDNYVNFSDGVYNFGDWGELTMTAWIKLESYNPTAEQMIYSDRNPGSFFAIRGESDSTNKRKLQFNDGGGNLFATTQLNLDEWYHVAMVVEDDGAGAADLYLYINGSNDGTHDDAVTLINGAVPWLGGEKITDTYYFDGIIDEFAIWNRSLTPTEISDLYTDKLTPISNNPPVVNLSFPANDSNYSSNSIELNFNCSAYDDINLENVTFQLFNEDDGSLNYSETNTSGINNTNYIFPHIVIPGNYTWNCLAYDNNTASSQAEFNYTLEIISIPDSPPMGNLYEPEDASFYIDAPILVNFTCDAYDDNQVSNVSLVINSINNLTNSSGLNNTNYSFSQTFGDGNYTWTCSIFDNSSQEFKPTERFFTVNTTAFIAFIQPTEENGTNFTTNIIPAAVNITPTTYFKNWTVFLYNSTSLYDSITFTNSTREFNFTVENDDNYYLNASVWTLTNQFNYTETRIYNVDFNVPFVNITSPENNTVINTFNQTININYTIEDFSLNECLLSYARAASFEDEWDGWTNNSRVYFNNTWSSIGNKSADIYDGGQLEKIINSSDYSYIVFDTNYVDSATFEQFGETTSSSEILDGDRSYNISILQDGEVEIQFAGAICFPSACDSTQVLIDNVRLYKTDGTVIKQNNTINCSEDTTNMTYPLYNPNYLDVILFGIDEYNNTNSSSITLLKNTTQPIINLISPVSDYGVLLLVNETLQLNYTITGNATTLDTCWYDYNSTNITLSSCENTTILLEVGNTNLTLYVNDTLGNFNSEFTNWSYRARQDSENYVNTTTSGAINNFNTTIETNGTQITLAYLIYNETRYLGTISSTGNTYTISRNQQALIVNGDSVNATFYWNITMEDDFSFNTNANNQTVNPLGISTVCDGNRTIINMTMYDEVTQEVLNETTDNTTMKVIMNLYTEDRSTSVKDYSFLFTRENPAAICINSNLTNGEEYSADFQIQYSANNYSSEFYNIYDHKINNSNLEHNLSLYILDEDNTQEFKLIARDASYLPIVGALIQIERKYIENGTFNIVEVPKTDYSGTTSASLQLNDVVYNFKIYKDGVLIDEFTNVIAICQTPLVSTCQIDFSSSQDGITMPDFETGDDFNFDITFDKSTRIITASYVIPSGEPSEVELVVETQDAVSENICTDVITSSSGYLYCTIPESFGNSTIKAELYKDDSLAGFGSISDNQDAFEIYDVILGILSVLTLMTLLGLAVSDSPAISIIFIVLGIMFLSSTFLINSNGFFGATATILFLVIAGIIFLIKAARRT